jgi:predicted AAA+ superfamily ATPase
MEIEELKKIIADQMEEASDLFKKEKIIEREVNIAQLQNFLKYPNILVISGVRRSGKSILAISLIKDKKHGHINFDDERLAGFKPEDFNKLLQSFYELFGNDLEYFVFDEIQNTSKWELFINRLRRSKKIIITGSNANLLSSELSTHLTGRYIDFNLLPFSFREFIKMKGESFEERDFYSTKRIAQIKIFLNEYVKFGGFPEVYKFGGRIVEKIYEDIINKDILLRYKIKKKVAFKELTKYLISNFAEETGYSRLKNIFLIKNIHTVKDYVSYLTSTYLIFMLEKFSFKLKQQFISPRKTYPIDTGIINFIAFQFSENIGKLIENIVFLDLLRRKKYWEGNLEIYFWQNYFKEEVDFVVKKNEKINQLIQVSFNISNPETKKREIKSLLKASEELKCNNLLIITWDNNEELKIKEKKITIIPLWKWLLC